MNEYSEIVIEYVGGGAYHVSLVKSEPTTNNDNIVFVRGFDQDSGRSDTHKLALMFADEIAVITGLPVNDGDA